MRDDLTAEELRKRVEGAKDELRSLIASLDPHSKPEGRAYGSNTTFDNGDDPPWTGEWDNHFDK